VITRDFFRAFHVSKLSGRKLVRHLTEVCCLSTFALAEDMSPFQVRPVQDALREVFLSGQEVRRGEEQRLLFGREIPRSQDGEG
jgi:hypothetical protein